MNYFFFNIVYFRVIFSGFDLSKIRLLEKPLKILVEPLRQAVTDTRT